MSSSTMKISLAKTIENGKFEDSLFEGYSQNNDEDGSGANGALMKRTMVNIEKSRVNQSLVFEKKYKQRFYVLILYSLAQILSSAAWLCFAGIYDKVEFIYRDIND